MSRVRLSRFPSIFIAALIFLLSDAGVVAQTVDVPPPLQPWTSWVMHGEEFRRCALRNGAEMTEAAAFECRWPGRLNINVGESGGEFSQRWQLQAESWVTLPGDQMHWPEAVMADGVAIAVVAHQGVPRVRLAAGTHELRGRFTWTRRPESLQVADATALVDLSIGGRRVAPVEIQANRLWLGAVRTLEQPRSLEVNVYRLLADGSPVTLTTELQLKVSGEAREEVLARALPESFIPLTTSGDLPFRFEPDGRLRVQVRSGSHSITIIARAPTGAARFELPSDEGIWPSEEVWGYRANDRLRITSITGAESIDPTQAAVPDRWRDVPTYRLARGAVIAIDERSRGLNREDANRLSLRRDLWLGFDRKSFDALDHVTGTMNEGWRLDMRKPFRLLKAQSDDELMLITDGTDARTGIEVRSPALNITALSRIDRDGSLPASGWDTRFESVQTTLHVPPGHRLLAAWGVDRSADAWINQWELLDMFLLLLVTVSAYRLLGWKGGALAATAMLLTYHEADAVSWLWINALLAVAMVRVVPEGKLRNVAQMYRLVSLAVLTLFLVPFMLSQYRLALHPQTEIASRSVIESVSTAGEPFGLAAEVARPGEATRPRFDLSASPAPLLAIEASPQRLAESAMQLPKALDRYAPDAMVQTGPGTPDWHFLSYDLRWTGPVDVSQSLRLTILSPLWMAVWRIGGIACSLLLLFALIRLAYGVPKGWNLPRFSRAASLTLVPFVLIGTMIPEQGFAQSPDAQLLEQLKQRLSRPALCAPQCAEIVLATVDIEGNRLVVDLDVHAQASVALGMPDAGIPWTIERVTVNQRPLDALARHNEVLELPMSPGVHRISLVGSIAAADEIALEFPVRPRRIVVRTQGWTSVGEHEGRLLNNALQLTRRVTSASSNATLTPQRLPTFVRIHRRVLMNLDWTMTTRVQRLAPSDGAFTLSLPTLPGEAVLTPGFEVRNGEVLVSMPVGVDYVEWESALARVDRMQWTAASDRPWVEQWDITVAPMWHAEFAGTPAVLPDGYRRDLWVNQFLPRPGESLDISVVRPAASPGETLAVDHATLHSIFSERLSHTDLEFSYRSSRGGQHQIRIPEDARILTLEADGQSLSLRPQQGVLPLTLAPGKHTVHVSFSRDTGASLMTRPPRVDIGADATNVRTRIELDNDRWVLFAWGPGVGNAVLYWSELAIFVVVALILGRVGGTPLRTLDWLLLGLGLSTLSWWVLLVFAVWVFLLAWRARWSAPSRWRYNALQVVLALTSIVVILIVIGAIPFGLLSAPQMGIRPEPWLAGGLSWFVDRTGPQLTEPVVISVSIWFYKLVILLWALWLSFALLRWLPWAWQQFSNQGVWWGRNRQPAADTQR